MAVTLSYSNITIRGITYKKGSSFKCYAAYEGAGGSEGEGSASALTKGTTYYVYAKASGSGVTHPYAVCTSSSAGASSIRGWYKENVFPYATYAVKFNANGGSGAPTAQTKTYGTTLKLSSTKPTRSGYTFQGWGTSAGDTSIDYAAGANYTANKAITLYAIWEANTYTVQFNANGGSSAPSSVSKTHGKTLTLPSGIPTRTNYEFLGWSTSSTASVATYKAGDTYTANANATLYAVWKLRYLPPTITNLKAIRCDVDGTPNDFGTCVLVTFDWGCSQLLGANNVSSITIERASEGSGVWHITDVTASGTSGSVSVIISSPSLSIETRHQVRAVVVDTLKSDGSGATISSAVTIPAAVFLIDFLTGGKGVAIGQPAAQVGFDVGMESSFRKPVCINNNNAFYYLNANGSKRQVITLNSSNNTHYGAGSYDNSEGSAYYSGNNTYLRAKGKVDISAPSGINMNNHAYFLNDGTIYGTKPNGEKVVAFNTCSTSGNVNMGYGNYTLGEGNSHIYGNNINFYWKGSIGGGYGANLWSGTLSNNGTITLPEWEKYRLFACDCLDEATVMLGYRDGNYLRCVGCYDSGSSASVFKANFQRTNETNNTVKLVSASSHLLGASGITRTVKQIGNIWGLF